MFRPLILSLALILLHTINLSQSSITANGYCQQLYKQNAFKGKASHLQVFHAKYHTQNDNSTESKETLCNYIKIDNNIWRLKGEKWMCDDVALDGGDNQTSYWDLFETMDKKSANRIKGTLKDVNGSVYLVGQRVFHTTDFRPVYCSLEEKFAKKLDASEKSDFIVALEFLKQFNLWKHTKKLFNVVSAMMNGESRPFATEDTSACSNATNWDSLLSLLCKQENAAQNESSIDSYDVEDNYTHFLSAFDDNSADLMLRANVTRPPFSFTIVAFVCLQIVTFMVFALYPICPNSSKKSWKPSVETTIETPIKKPQLMNEYTSNEELHRSMMCLSQKLSKMTFNDETDQIYQISCPQFEQVNVPIEDASSLCSFAKEEQAEYEMI